MRSVLVLWLSSLFLLLSGACAGRQRAGIRYEMNPLPTASAPDLTVQSPPVVEVAKTDPAPVADRPDATEPWSIDRAFAAVDFDVSGELKRSREEAQMRINAKVQRDLAAHDASNRAAGEKLHRTHVRESPPNNDEIVASLTKNTASFDQARSDTPPRDRQVAVVSHATAASAPDSRTTTQVVVIPADKSATTPDPRIRRMPIDNPSAPDSVQGHGSKPAPAALDPPAVPSSVLPLIFSCSLVALVVGILGGFIFARYLARKQSSLVEKTIKQDLGVMPPDYQASAPDASQETSGNPQATPPASQAPVATDVPQGTPKDPWAGDHTDPDIPQLVCVTEQPPAPAPTPVAVPLSPEEKQRLDETPLELRTDFSAATVEVNFADN